MEQDKVNEPEDSRSQKFVPESENYSQKENFNRISPWIS